MNISIKRIISQTFGSFFYADVVVLFFLPFAISLTTGFIFLWLTWGYWTQLLVSGLVLLQPLWQQFLQIMPDFIIQIALFFSPLMPVFVFILIIGIAFPLLVVFNLIMTSLLTSGYLVRKIAKHDFPGLEKKGHSRIFAGLLNTIVAVVGYLFLWVITMPLWLIPGMQLVVPVVLTAWLSRKVCTFDALSDYATDEEMSSITLESKRSGYILGLITAGINYFPMAIFFSPVITMIAYVYMSLGFLKNKRSL
ncbi:MAG: EI24 domain-containing protein [Pseudobdellovibrio sp.]